jgi:hypothetical protein
MIRPFAMKLLTCLCPLVLCSLLSAAQPETLTLDNGRDLTGWSGNPKFWSVQDGAITGRSTAAEPLTANTFLIWEGGQPENFELRVQFRMSGERANSGVQYRSRVIDAATWSVGGYQADMDVENQYTGMFYEERGRGIVARPGERIRLGAPDAEGRPQLAPLGPAEDAAAIKRAIRRGEWNELVIIAEGNHLRHYVNGLLTAEVRDLDPKQAANKGVIALQLHSGPPMTVQFKSLRLRRLP